VKDKIKRTHRQQGATLEKESVRISTKQAPSDLSEVSENQDSLLRLTTQTIPATRFNQGTNEDHII
jgi:hypothetical protein